MSKNKYQRQRAMRKPTAGAKGSLVFQGGVVRFQAPLRSNLVTAVADAATTDIPSSYQRKS